jgi:hypothetical protein
VVPCRPPYCMLWYSPNRTTANPVRYQPPEPIDHRMLARAQQSLSVAGPNGVERADAINIRIPIEGADGLLAEGA